MNASLPQFTKEEDGKVVDKNYKVPGNLTVSKILDFLYDNLDVKSSVMDTNRDN